MPPAIVTREVLLIKATGDIVIRDVVRVDDARLKLSRSNDDAVGREAVSRARRIISRFHLDPAVAPTVCGSDVRLTTRGRDLWLQVIDPIGPIAIQDGWISPSYGVRTPTSTIVLQQDVVLPITMTCRFGIHRLERAELVAAASGLNECVNC